MDLLRGFSSSYAGGVDNTTALQDYNTEVGVALIDQQVNEHYESDGFEHSEGHMTNESEESEFPPSNDESEGEGEDQIPFSSERYNSGVYQGFSQSFDLNEPIEESDDYVLPDFDDEDHMDVWNEDSNEIRLGMCFNSKNDVMYAVRRWNVGCNREIYVADSKPSLWKARCKTTQPQKDTVPVQQTPLCRWRVTASKKRKHHMWRITTWTGAHSCYSTVIRNNNRALRFKDVAAHIFPQIREDISFPVKQIRAYKKEKLKVDITYSKAWTARRIAIERIHGNWESNFNELPNTTQRRKYRLAKCEMRGISEEAWQYLNNIEKSKWTVVFDERRRRWGNLTTNISESLNNVLRGARLLPIKACIDFTFQRDVTQYVKHTEIAMSCNTALPPRMWRLFNHRDSRSREHQIFLFDLIEARYRVISRLQTNEDGGNDYTVEYRKKTCTCGKWQIYRFPCSHAIAVCHWRGEEPHEIVNNRFHTSTYRAQYSGHFYPLTHCAHWREPGWKIRGDTSRITVSRGRRRARRIHNEMDTHYAEERRPRLCGLCREPDVMDEAAKVPVEDGQDKNESHTLSRDAMEFYNNGDAPY
ncbi:hypothetical protein E3N88_10790 [Mikania micrantha]|uniref:SWIM-type domain-containing protein n=1 Tax=Mikania micrantha TaxID=192012 RepID=A0A5N6PCR4_9ASTR|nr:hypothetical protein E3N88_10790 [Mikania micrantha]